MLAYFAHLRNLSLVQSEMSSNDHSPLGLTCPAGGTFYVCAEAVHRFIGCCGVDACLPNGCPAGQLQATSFSASTPLAPDQECNAGQFYTCADTKPSFWGCCMTNPCTAGECAATDLAGAMLSSNPALAAPYLRGSPAQSLNSSTGTSSSSAPASGSESPSDHHQKAPISAIIGASLGAFFLALLCFIGIYFIFRRRAASKKANTLKHGSQGTEATLFNADSKFAYCGTPQSMSLQIHSKFTPPLSD
jgi:hypothetical protein